MRKVYLENGSTSFPKAPGVAEAMSHFITEVGRNISRGGYETAYDLGDTIFAVSYTHLDVYKRHGY